MMTFLHTFLFKSLARTTLTLSLALFTLFIAKRKKIKNRSAILLLSLPKSLISCKRKTFHTVTLKNLDIYSWKVSVSIFLLRNCNTMQIRSQNYFSLHNLLLTLLFVVGAKVSLHFSSKTSPTRKTKNKTTYTP